jgi:Tfp pilus assembly protein PilZ
VFCERQGAPPVQGTARDIGVGGAFVESTEPLLFGTEVVIVARLANGGAALRLPAIVRWAKPNGFGVQFGLLGARETHALAELSKR